MSRWACLVVLGVGLTFVCPVGASATTLLPVTFEEMAKASQVIVHGRVVDVRGRATGDRRSIDSLITVQVIDTFKGDVVPAVVFHVPGGQVGRYRRVVVGVPTFVRGDEVVLFLKGRAPSTPIPFGLSQGVYRVVHRADGAALVTQPLVVGTATGAGAGGAAPTVRGDPARRPLELTVFATRLRDVLGGRP